MKQVHKKIFISFVLSDQVWWCNLKQSFELIQKLHLQIYVSQIMIYYSTSICPLESGKCGKEEENFNILRMKKTF